MTKKPWQTWKQMYEEEKAKRESLKAKMDLPF